MDSDCEALFRSRSRFTVYCGFVGTVSGQKKTAKRSTPCVDKRTESRQTIGSTQWIVELAALSILLLVVVVGCGCSRANSGRCPCNWSEYQRLIGFPFLWEGTKMMKQSRRPNRQEDETKKLRVFNTEFPVRELEYASTPNSTMTHVTSALLDTHLKSLSGKLEEKEKRVSCSLWKEIFYTSNTVHKLEANVYVTMGPCHLRKSPLIPAIHEPWTHPLTKYTGPLTRSRWSNHSVTLVHSLGHAGPLTWIRWFTHLDTLVHSPEHSGLLPDTLVYSAGHSGPLTGQAGLHNTLA
uniref:Uncharacterized protein n=1 Tax=Timema poppense TaxID=170557 RepID=A0A7R9D864_TIMPO|nr:unnamed protein product [Timema poppensis]